MDTDQRGNNPINTIFNKGLPPIKHVGGKSSSTSTSKHVPATLNLGKFTSLQNLPITHPTSGQPMMSTMWLQYQLKQCQPLQWSAESDLTRFVINVIDDITIKSLVGIDVNCLQELSLFDMRPDVMLVCSFGVPIGFVEVKKPGANIMDNAQVCGQMFDYLTYLKEYTGQRYPLGILTTYLQWRIFWLGDSNELAELTTRLPSPTPQKPNGPKLSLLPDALPMPTWDSDAHAVPQSWSTPKLQDGSTAPLGSRIVNGSDIFEWDNKSLPDILLSCLYKMLLSPIDPASFSPLKSYIYVTKTEWRWEKFSSCRDTHLELTVGKTVPANFQNVFLLHHLGGGGDGRVWLGSTDRGKVCVIKFSNEESTVIKEAKVWNEVWPDCKVCIKQLNNYWALVMPWVKPCSMDEYKTQEVQGAVFDAVQKLAHAGYEHDDLALRQIGLYQQESKVKAVLFDFARVSEVEKGRDNAVDSAISSMMEQLELIEQPDF